MKWSLKLGRILGIDVYIHFAFLLLLGFIGLSHWMAERSPAAAANGMIFFLCLFGCVLLHEYGHALMARRYGIPTKDITLLPIGGMACLERMPDKPSEQLWVALAGPASATQSSCMGLSGIRSRRATPPMGSSVISLVGMP